MDRVVRIAGRIENCYLVTGGRCYLVDTGAAGSRGKIGEVFEEEGVKPCDLTHIFLTHYHADHTGNLAWLKRESGARVAAGTADVPYIQGDEPQELGSDLNRLGRLLRRLPRPLVEGYQRFEAAAVDLPLDGGDVLSDLGLEVISLPGHTPGGIGLLDRASHRAFVGDLVSNYFGRTGGPVYSASRSLVEIEASLRRLAGLDLDYMYPGHGRIVGPRASEKVAAYVRKKFG